MVVIFSGERIEGLMGNYAAPSLATGAELIGATVAYTDNKRIIALAREKGVEVRDFPKHPPTNKVEPITALPEVTDTSMDFLTPLEPLEPLTQVDDTVLTANSSIEDDIKAGMTTGKLKAKYSVSGAEIGKIRRSLKAK